MLEAVDLSQVAITGFAWDKGNRDKNWLKHQVKAKECEEIFFNIPLLFFRDTRHSQKEERIVAYGQTDQGRKLTIIFTIRKQQIRVISARVQQKKERRIYEAQSNS